MHSDFSRRVRHRLQTTYALFLIDGDEHVLLPHIRILSLSDL